MKKFFTITSLLLFFSTTPSVVAQKKQATTSLPQQCLTQQVYERLKKKYPHYHEEAPFEEWMRTEKARSSQERTTEEIIEVPVIFHIIHKNEPIGTGTNLSAAQIASQIQVLNEDFRRQNADTILTPSVFKNVAADIKIVFKPAQVYPNGQPLEEAGIRRYYQGSTKALSDEEIDTVIKPATFFDPTRYLNIWVADIADNFGSKILGYATFPEASGLPGIPESDIGIASQDGVVLHYRATGSNYTGHGTFNLFPKNDKGRTATHEIGHYLGLRHIWGDGGCDVDDYCNDTPLQGDPYRSNDCGIVRNTCIEPTNDRPDMIQNYMDYSDDVCMNIFTQDQKFRMRTVLTKSPRRKELALSAVDEPADPNKVYAYFQTSATKNCIGQLVTFTDNSTAGANTSIDTWHWNFDTNNIGKATPAQATTKGPHHVRFEKHGTYTILLTIRGKNGAISTYTQTVEILEPATIAPPYVQTFENNFPPDKWTFLPSSLWRKAPVGYLSSSSLMIDNFENDLRNNKNVVAFTPSFTINKGNASRISFDIAYAPYDDNGITIYDSLVLVYTTSCGFNFQVFRPLSRQELQTAPKTTQKFFPSTANQWKNININFNAFPSLPKDSLISIGFWNLGNYGNAIYIDNVVISDENDDDKPPFVKKPLGTLNLPKNHPVVMFNLLDHFDDIDTDVSKMIFEIASNTNPNLVDVMIDQKILNVFVRPQQQGSAVIEVLAISNSKRTSDRLTVNVSDAFAVVARPTNVTVSLQQNNTVIIKWKDNSNNEEGFIVQRSIGEEVFLPIKTTPPNVTEVLDDELGEQPNCEKIRYRVLSFKEQFFSSFSDTARFFVKGKAPLLTSIKEEFTRDFPQNGWQITNPSGHGWRLALLGANNSPYSIYIDNYTYDYSKSDAALIELPAVDASNANHLTLSFDVAYAMFKEDDEERADALTIYYSNDCGERYENLFVITGDLLATAPSEGNRRFIPQSPRDWQHFSISLQPLVSMKSTNLRVAIGNRGNFAQAIYLDNIELHQDPLVQTPILKALVRDTRTVRLIWEDIADETGYELERSLAARGGFQKIATLAANTTTYDDTGLDPEKVYFYRIRALRQQRVSNYSQAIKITTNPNHVGDDEGENSIGIFPNPTKDELFLRLPSSFLQYNLEISVWRIDGKQQNSIQLQLSSNNQYYYFSTHQLPNGMYLLKLTAGNHVFYRKFVVER
ncbi:MAG: M43 family zinc metalloprotease [Flammeovirgaceae bacterium]|nr:M43 family zinc metalloprotease [Flammeovirgaceae bacterium]MDW8286637.1 M43 family zinc metalloprotease [Flammeovirgaceae bacterium]